MGQLNMEHRCGVRRPVDCVVTVVGPDSYASRGVLRDASIGGAFVEMDSSGFRPFATVELQVHVPTRGGLRLYCSRAMVVRATTDGIGLMFDSVDARLITALIMQRPGQGGADKKGDEATIVHNAPG